MKDKQTPLLKQYNQIKEKYPETILLYRLGDFYETFGDDAITTSKVCGIVLTKRNHGAAGDLPLAGFPYHQLDAYLPKLVRAGHRVAVCEQLEDPKFARGIVKRDVVEVVTPGVSLYDKLLDTKKNNYVASVVLEKGSAGLAACDISTGEFLTCEIPAVSVGEVLESLCPAELVISKTQKDEINTLILGLSSNPAITKLEEWIFGESFGREVLLRHFKTQNLKGFGIDGLNLAIAAAGAILHYILETQKSQVQQISRLTLYNPSEYMPLDYATRRNLEILYSFSDNTAQSSLISILDKTSTAMGGRLLKKWITRPLLNLDKIQSRLDAVEAILNNNGKREVLRKILSDISDLERLISKVCTGRANPREVVVLKQSLLQIPKIKEILREINHPSLTSLASKLNPLVIIIDLIETALVEEPSVQLGAGSVFRPKYDAELDSYVEAKYSGKSWISNYQEDERRKTGITSLKVGFTSVFGYYIEVTNLHSSKVPDEYQRKQTLTNAERYTTKELKEYESKILGAEEKINELEQRLFAELRSKIALQTEAIQEDAYLISSLDCLTAFAQASHEYSYCKPVIDNSTVIEIHDGRHPVVERLLGIEKKFTPNSTLMDSNSGQVHIITGPNMSGKSCYLRQTALIVLMGQIGCFVPAKSAHFGCIDRIFTRVGAQDNLAAGESTFLVEMQEAANIMNNATQKSLILLDEVGRGTATFDGISIAWAITEYIHNSIGAKTLFATHYHELNELAGRYERIINYKVEVIESGSTVIFSHKVMPGASDHSFGIHVAKMAGLPQLLIERANEIMHSLEGTATDTDEKSKSKPDTSTIKTINPKSRSEQLAIFEFRDDELRNRLFNLNVNKLTPIEALQIISDWQKEAKKGW